MPDTNADGLEWNPRARGWLPAAGSSPIPRRGTISQTVPQVVSSTLSGYDTDAEWTVSGSTDHFLFNQDLDGEGSLLGPGWYGFSAYDSGESSAGVNAPSCVAIYWYSNGNGPSGGAGGVGTASIGVSGSNYLYLGPSWMFFSGEDIASGMRFGWSATNRGSAGTITVNALKIHVDYIA